MESLIIILEAIFMKVISHGEQRNPHLQELLDQTLNYLNQTLLWIEMTKPDIRLRRKTKLPGINVEMYLNGLRKDLKLPQPKFVELSIWGTNMERSTVEQAYPITIRYQQRSNPFDEEPHQIAVQL